MEGRNRPRNLLWSFYRNCLWGNAYTSGREAIMHPAIIPVINVGPMDMESTAIRSCGFAPPVGVSVLVATLMHWSWSPRGFWVRGCLNQAHDGNDNMLNTIIK